MSKPLIRPAKSEAINSDIYINECLNERLLPFIHKYHQDMNYIFWPDLASAHYSKATLEWMKQNVNYVAKRLNSPNVLQARPIENFRDWLTQKVYDGGWVVLNEQHLIRHIEFKLKEFDTKSVENLMKGVKGRLKSIADNGVFFLLKKVNFF
jgi:hypothetical protein